MPECAPAQEKILQLKGSKSDSTWEYTQRRTAIGPHSTWRPRQRIIGRRPAVSFEKALQQRPDWFELHLVKAELELMDGKEDKASASLKRPSSWGRSALQVFCSTLSCW